MDWALFWAAVLMGAAGTPHCAAMCGPACMALAPAGRAWQQLAFQLARLASYALAGALAASSMALLAQLGQASSALRPLWTLVHAAALALGVWMVWRARQPAWLEALGRARQQPSGAGPGWAPMALHTAPPAAFAGQPPRQAVRRAPWRAGMAGSLWVAWPCGLLQSALLTAALANSPVGGAAVMAGFGAVSAAGLLAAPWLFGGAASAGRRGRLSPAAARFTVRLAGGVLVVASAWALWRAATGQVFCLT